jgi:hypothetical protein
MTMTALVHCRARVASRAGRVRAVLIAIAATYGLLGLSVGSRRTAVMSGCGWLLMVVAVTWRRVGWILCDVWNVSEFGWIQTGLYSPRRASPRRISQTSHLDQRVYIGPRHPQSLVHLHEMLLDRGGMTASITLDGSRRDPQYCSQPCLLTNTVLVPQMRHYASIILSSDSMTEDGISPAWLLQRGDQIR